MALLVSKDQQLIDLIPSFEDKFNLAPGFESQVLISWGDAINSKDFFGYNNDFIAFIPLDNSKTEGLMWVNHEYVHPLFVSGHVIDENYSRKTKAQAETEMKAVGGSIIHIKKINDSWKLVEASPYYRRLDTTTPIPFSKDTEVYGNKVAIGTLANCAGVVTPWNTFLTCEENY